MTPTAKQSPLATARASIRVSSLVSIPPAGPPGGPWAFESGRKEFDLKVSLEGRGTVAVLLEVSRPGGQIVHTDDQRHDVDGRLELTFPNVTLPVEGSYTLALKVSAPGVRQRSEVTIRRG